MLFAHSSHGKDRPVFEISFLIFIIVALLIPVSVFAQGSGRASTGTGGAHVISGHVYYPSGRRGEGSIQVKLESYTFGEISVLADSGGSFIFSQLSPGNYTVVIDAGEGFEKFREAVFIDTDVDLSKFGMPTPSTSRRYTVMAHLRLKADSGNRTKPSVVNAALAAVPEDARKLYETAVQLARTDAAKAVDNLKAAIARYPNFPLALNELGVQYLKLGEPRKAIEALKTAAKLSPDSFDPKLNLGIALLQTGQFADAEKQLREALKQNESAATAHLYLGVTLAKLHNYTEAEKELTRAVELGGNQLGLAHYYLGGLYWQKREYRRAADELETYLRLTPNAPKAEQVRATIKDLRGRS